MYSAYRQCDADADKFHLLFKWPSFPALLQFRLGQSQKVPVCSVDAPVSMYNTKAAYGNVGCQWLLNVQPVGCVTRDFDFLVSSIFTFSTYCFTYYVLWSLVSLPSVMLLFTRLCCHYDEGHSAAGWGIGGSVIAAEDPNPFIRAMGCRYLRCTM